MRTFIEVLLAVVIAYALGRVFPALMDLLCSVFSLFCIAVVIRMQHVGRKLWK